MSAQLLDGKTLADLKQRELKVRVDAWIAEGKRPPALAVILLGSHAPSEIYVANKIKACEKVGIQAQLLRLPEGATESMLLTEIEKLNHDPAVDGILVQMPLPRRMDAQRVLLAIDPSKDVDGFHPLNMGRLILKMPGLRPATPKGMMILLDHYVGEMMGLYAVVVGASNIVGRPMSLELLNRRATVSICHSKTKDLALMTKNADLLVVAVGIPNFIQAEQVKPGAIVVDVGINRLADGALVGDVDFKAVSEVAAWISPVPGGVGPMTIMGLLDNTVRAYESRYR